MQRPVLDENDGNDGGATASAGNTSSVPNGGAGESAGGASSTLGGSDTTGPPKTSLCDPSQPFDTPQAHVAWPHVGGLSFAHDGQTLFISGAVGDETLLDPGGAAIYAAERSDTGDFGSFTLLDAVHTATNEWAPFISDDGLTLYYNTFVATHVELWSSRRTEVTAAFSGGSRVGGINSDSGYGRASAWLPPNELTLYFVGQQSDLSWDVFVAKRGDRERAFDRPEPIVEINSDSTEYYPTLTADELTIYFTSYREDVVAHGGADIWVASRHSLADPFGAPENVSELNTAGDEYSGWISPDGCVFYFLGESAQAGELLVYQASRRQRHE